jgi:PAS domain S-box-containing protein
MKTVNVSASEVLNANILIVDEHDTNTIPLKRLLNNSGYRNVSFTDAFHDVIHLHRRFQYDLILLNLQMPEVDETELFDGLQKIQNEGALPVLAIIDKATDTLRALPPGAKDFIRKPFDMLEVKTRIHNMLVIRFLDKKIENYNSTVEAVVQERTAALRESEARLRSLVELSSDWYWEQDRHGKFTKISGPVLEMLGVEESISGDGNNARRLQWLKREREQLDGNIAAKRPFLDFSYSLIRPDGSHQYLRVSGEPMFDTAGCFSGYRGVGIDISEHMHMEEKLLNFRKASDDAGDAILFVDRTNMHLLDANDIAAKLWGYTREELLGLNFKNIVCCGHHDAHGLDNPIADTPQKIDAIHIKHKNGTAISAEMLCQNSKRSGEKNKSIVFVHQI